MNAIQVKNPSTDIITDTSSTTNQMPLAQTQYDQLTTLLQNSSISTLTRSSTSNQMSTSHISPNQTLGTVCNITFNTNTFPHSWILDSSANDHVCSSLNLLTSYYKITPIRITLPYGNCTIVQYAGNISFTHVLYLSRGLFSP